MSGRLLNNNMNTPTASNIIARSFSGMPWWLNVSINWSGPFKDVLDCSLTFIISFIVLFSIVYTIIWVFENDSYASDLVVLLLLPTDLREQMLIDSYDCFVHKHCFLPLHLSIYYLTMIYLFINCNQFIKNLHSSIRFCIVSETMCGRCLKEVLNAQYLHISIWNYLINR